MKRAAERCAQSQRCHLQMDILRRNAPLHNGQRPPVEAAVRPITFQTNYTRWAEGSVPAQFGNWQFLPVTN